MSRVHFGPSVNRTNLWDWLFLHIDATATHLTRRLFNGLIERDSNRRIIVVSRGSLEWVFRDQFMGLVLASSRLQQHGAETLKRIGVDRVSVLLRVIWERRRRLQSHKLVLETDGPKWTRDIILHVYMCLCRIR